MTLVRATSGSEPADPAEGARISYLVLRARHAAQAPVCHRCFTDRPRRTPCSTPSCNRHLVWLLPLIMVGGVALLGPETARAAIGAAIGTMLGAQPIRPSVEVSSTLFPQSVPGFDQEHGLTLPDAPRSDDEAAGRGVRAAGILFQPSLDIGAGYDSNVLGARGRPGSAILSQTPALSLTTEGSVVRVGAFADVENSLYLNQPRQSRTDYRAAIGATADLGTANASLGYSHLHLHDDPAAIGSIASSEPTPFDVDDVRAGGTITLGRLSLLPFADYSHWAYGKVRIGGVETDQSFRDRDVIQVGSAARMMIGERRDLLASVSFVSTQFKHDFGPFSPPSSNGVLAMGGVDYEMDAAIKARVLLGVQARLYKSGLYRDRVVAVGQAALTWLPQRQTEVTLAVSRSLEDLAQEDPGGTVYSRAELAVSHEYFRQLVLRARLGLTSAEFLQVGGTQVAGYTGAGFTWAVNRHWKLVGDAEISRVSSPIRNVTLGAGTVPGGPYTRVQTGLHLTTAL